MFGDPEDLLVSPNDRQPYVIVLNANPGGGPTEYKQMFPILAYERKARADAGGHRHPRPADDGSEGDLSKLTFVGRHQPATN